MGAWQSTHEAQGGGGPGAGAGMEQVLQPAGPTLAKLPSDAELRALEKVLGYTFKDKWTLRTALIHPSYGELNNSRLTWLGDSVMGAAMSDLLFEALPDASTAALHDRRTALVRCEACATGASALGLPGLLVVGKGYEGKEPTPHMLAEGFEAVWGALYVDAGCSLAQVKRTYSELFPLAAPAAAAEGQVAPVAGAMQLGATLPVPPAT